MGTTPNTHLPDPSSYHQAWVRDGFSYSDLSCASLLRYCLPEDKKHSKTCQEETSSKIKEVRDRVTLISLDLIPRNIRPNHSNCLLACTSKKENKIILTVTQKQRCSTKRLVFIMEQASQNWHCIYLPWFAFCLLILSS